MIFRTAGAIGVDPMPLSLRQLNDMRAGREEMLWGHTSELLAMLYNINRGKDSSALSPIDFNPYVPKAVKQRVRRERQIEVLSGLKDSLPQVKYVIPKKQPNGQ